MRELKQLRTRVAVLVRRRTLPRVRELKPLLGGVLGYFGQVAPFPGCVN